MADVSRSIFNKKATDKLRSPDDLDKYVQVTNPSVWVVLAACIALLIGLLAWGLLGSVTTSVSSTGVCVNGKAMCFLSAEDVAKVHVGDVANVNGERMEVAEVAAVPVSRNEAGEVLSSDYLVSALMQDDWAYQVTFDGDTSGMTTGIPISVSITVEQIAPIKLVLGGNA
jgi:hypothetical protein